MAQSLLQQHCLAGKKILVQAKHMNASGNVTSDDDPDISREKLISGALLYSNKSARCFDTDFCEPGSFGSCQDFQVII
jgi:hypothetical protein